MTTAILIIDRLVSILSVLLFIWAIMTFVLPPYHPLREALDRLFEPLLAPIRRVMPATGPIDFSPMVLWLLLILISRVLIGVLSSMR